MAIKTLTETSHPTDLPAPPTPSGPLLEVEGLTVRYGSGRDAVTAVDEVSFDIAPGERVALVGESGSGKSTLGLAVAGLLTQDDVHVTGDRFVFGGRPVARPRRTRLPSPTPGLAMVLQDAMTSLDPVWTIGSQLAAVLRAGGRLSRRQVRDRCRHWLTRVGLHDTARVMAARPYELSGGMRQRAMLAIALCGGPRLLIADEPTSALDASLARETMETFLELTRDSGTSVLFISHDILLSQEYSDRMLVMNGGRIVERGASAALAETARHPYTLGLLRCVPTLASAELEELPTLDSAACLRAGAET